MTSSRDSPAQLDRARAGFLPLAALLAWCACSAAQAQGGKAPLFKYVGSPDYPALLKEPAVQSQLQALVGKQLPALMLSINVSGDMGLAHGAIEISGNAPHKGGEEEGVICVDPGGGLVQAAMLSKGRITVFAKDRTYEFLMVCVKDWITQVNSGHRDRFTQPKNVQFGKPN